MAWTEAYVRSLIDAGLSDEEILARVNGDRFGANTFGPLAGGYETAPGYEPPPELDYDPNYYIGKPGESAYTPPDYQGMFGRTLRGATEIGGAIGGYAAERAMDPVGTVKAIPDAYSHFEAGLGDVGMAAVAGGADLYADLARRGLGAVGMDEEAQWWAENPPGEAILAERDLILGGYGTPETPGQWAGRMGGTFSPYIVSGVAGAARYGIPGAAAGDAALDFLTGAGDPEYTILGQAEQLDPEGRFGKLRGAAETYADAFGGFEEVRKSPWKSGLAEALPWQLLNVPAAVRGLRNLDEAGAAVGPGRLKGPRPRALGEIDEEISALRQQYTDLVGNRNPVELRGDPQVEQMRTRMAELDDEWKLRGEVDAVEEAGEIPSHVDVEGRRLWEARRQGFKTDQQWYHGTDRDFEAFNPGAVGRDYTEEGARAIWLSDDPSLASEFAGMAGREGYRQTDRLRVSQIDWQESSGRLTALDEDGEEVFREVGVTADKLREFLGEGPAEELMGLRPSDLGDFAREQSPALARRLDGVRTLEGDDLVIGGAPPTVGANIKPLFVRDRAFLEVDVDGPYHPTIVNEALDRAEAEGYAGVDFFNMSEPSPKSRFDTEPRRVPVQRAVFDPADVRSVSARFDPANVGKPDLLGGVLGPEGSIWENRPAVVGARGLVGAGIGAGADEENRLRGAAIGAAAGIAGGEVLERTLKGAPPPSRLRGGSRSGHLIPAVRNPATGLTATGATHPTILNEAWQRGIDLGEDVRALRGYVDSETGEWLTRAQAGGIRAEHLEGYQDIPFRVANNVETPEQAWRVTHEHVSEGLHGVFRSTPSEHHPRLTQAIEESLEGGQSGDVILDLVAPSARVKRRLGVGVYEGQGHPNVVLEIEGATREEIEGYMRLRGLVTAQDAEAGFRARGRPPTTLDDISNLGEDEVFGVVLRGDIDDLSGRLERAGIDSTVDGDEILVLDFGGRGSRLLEELQDAVGSADHEVFTDVFESIYLPRESYADAVGSTETAEQLARILDERIGPAYEGFAREVGFDPAADLSSLGELSRGLAARASPDAQRWWTASGRRAIEDAPATARSVDLVPRIPTDDPVAEIASQALVKRGRVNQRVMRQIAGDPELGEKAAEFVAARIGEMSRSLPLPTPERLAEVLETGAGAGHFYRGSREAVESILDPEDADMFLRFLAATSGGTDAASSNISAAAKAFGQWKLGLDFTGYRFSGTPGMLRDAASGQLFGSRKIQQYYRALMGDPDAYVHDMWMGRLFGFGDKATDAQYRYAEQVVRRVADEHSLTVAETQEALWSGMKRWWESTGLGRVTDVEDYPALLRKVLGEGTDGGTKPWSDPSIVTRIDDPQVAANFAQVVGEDLAKYQAKYGSSAGHSDLLMVRALVTASGAGVGAMADEENRLRGAAIGLGVGGALALLPDVARALLKADDAGHLALPAKGSRASGDLGSWWSHETGLPISDWNRMSRPQQTDQINQLARMRADVATGGPGTLIGRLEPEPGLLRGGADLEPESLEGPLRASLRGPEAGAMAGTDVARSVVGAGLGGAAGYASSEDTDERIVRAALGALGGAVVGPALRHGAPNKLRKAINVMRSSMLSLPATTMRNVIGNTIQAAIDLPTQAASALVDRIALAGITGERVIGGLRLEDLAAASRGAATDGVAQMRHAWFGTLNLDDVRSRDWDRIRTALAEGGASLQELRKMDIDPVVFQNRFVHAATEAVFRTMSATDRPFYYLALHRSISEQTRLMAQQLAEGADEVADLARQLRADPPDQVVLFAALDAAEAVYRDPGQMRNALKDLRAIARKKGESVEAMFDMVIPFQSTPANIATRVLQTTPLGYIDYRRSKTALKRMVEGNKNRVDLVIDDFLGEQAPHLEGVGDALSSIREQGEEAMGLVNQRALQRRAAKAGGRALVGTAAVTLGWILKDEITRMYPRTDTRERNQAQLADEQYGSIIIDDRTFNLERIGPLATVLVMGAELARRVDENGGESRLATVGTEVQKLVEEVVGASPYGDVRELGNLIQGEYPGTTFLERLGELGVDRAGAMVPNIVAGVASGMDDVQRESRRVSVVDAIRSRVPGLRQQLPRRIDALGREQERDGGLVGLADRMFNPFTSRGREDNELVLLLDELDVNLPDARNTVGMQELDRGTPEYEERARIYGQEVETAILDVLENADPNMDRDALRRRIERAASNAKTRVTRSLR